ncbi:hypothetical protein KIN20_009401 [Parelaphostrongylus tenuis]|uniref:Uncharacterized protein n=1 Tax=Parelaphostrongylus tenuis TaxID=148309 RepID=A0AAD5QNC5_PARTN|nr:hypothetical protein KIN20_009401 [Parelaphostrongylus tenuis]
MRIQEDDQDKVPEKKSDEDISMLLIALALLPTFLVSVLVITAIAKILLLRRRRAQVDMNPNWGKTVTELTTTTSSPKT